MRRLLIPAAALLLASGCGKPPQIGPDEEVHKATDALFTAVTARDTAQLDRCETRLAELHTQGKLPAAAHETLTGIIGKARGGGWEPAAERLYEFIKGQETGPEHAPKPSKRNGKR